ncbi:hypothetical protein [Streptomyces sp. NPDC020141]|uniref:hypothetical protein n=1 Tax=Streptomyces sp. NPDC020141 TaxID=3365065 RepID=UPI00378C13DC
MSAADDILLGLRQSCGGEVGDLSPEQLLDRYRAEVLREAADFLSEIGTPITGLRSGHERGLMHGAMRLRRMADETITRGAT